MPAATLLALALGRTPARHADWDTVLAMAIRERCAALAWHRAGDVIRAHAPRAIVGRWRQISMELMEQADAWTALLVSATRALRAAGVSVVIIKGLPLSKRLYGSTAVRPLADIDLFVVAAERPAARTTLETLGWTLVGGAAPGEEVFVLRHGPRRMTLEVHSSLTDDALLPHLSWPAPGTEQVTIGGESVPAHAGDLLAPYLAVHLAKHPMPPLLWFIDFQTLWSTLDERARAAARAAARALRAHRYLEWAIARGQDVDDAAGGDAAAARRLGFAGARRSDIHNALRVATLAASPLDAARVVYAWAAPRDLRHSPRQLLRRTAWRLAAPLRRARPRRRYALAAEDVGSAGSSAGTAERSLSVGAPELLALVRDVTARGGAMWVRASGTSMAPSIASGARVRLVAPTRPRVGDIVLAALPSGDCVLHRVRRMGASRVILCGDGNVRDDPAIDAAAIVAVADRIDDGRGERPLAALPGLLSLRRGLRRALHAQSPASAT